MEIVVAKQQTYHLDPRISMEEARGRAAAQKPKVFGALSQLLSRAKDGEIELVDLGTRYEPLWNAACHMRFEYDRKESYRIPFKLPTNITAVTINGQRYPLETGKDAGVTVPATSHHLEQTDREIWVNAVTGEDVKGEPYAKAAKTLLTEEKFEPPNATIEDPKIRASAVVRRVLGNDVKPLEADAIQEETVQVERIDLYFVPMYDFRFDWSAKKKSADMTIDAITGELQPTKREARVNLRNFVYKDLLFDVSAETLPLLIPAVVPHVGVGIIAAPVIVRVGEAISRVVTKK